jgi:protease IV
MTRERSTMKKLLLIIAGVAGALLLIFGLSVLAFLLLLGEEHSLASGDAVGVVEVKGIILDSQETVKQLRECGRNDRVKAVLLRIDSPGGVVAPSQEIHEEVKKLAAKKKVVVSMGSLAASGGYYIAVPATVIYANPGTITGSIGVIIKLSNFQELMDRIGMKVTTIKTGRFKDVGSVSRPVTEEDKALLQGVIDSSYGQFVKAVAQGRKLPEEQVRQLADGRIFTGEQALALKLVDRLGNMQDALAEAGKLGGTPGEPPLFRPKKEKKLLDMLVEETASRLSGMARRQGFSLNYELDAVQPGR